MIKTSVKVKLAVVGFALISFFVADKASAADFNIVPGGSTLGLNQTVTVDIKISTASSSINAAQGTLKFDPAIVQVKDISKANSVFNFWLTEPTFSNTEGKIEFLGGTPNGVAGGALQVLRIVFTASGVGNSNLTFVDSAISAADGSGKNIVVRANGANFIVLTSGGVPGKTPAPTTGPKPSATPRPSGLIPTPEQIVRTPAPAVGLPVSSPLTVTIYREPSLWYNIQAPFTASWALPPDIIGVSTLLNQNARTEAPTISEGLFANKTFPTLLDDGVYYLHIRFQNGKGWSQSVHYRVAMDTQPPLPFQISVTTGGLVSNDPAPTLSFNTGDSLSGISRYAILINSESIIYSDKSQYQLTPHAPGTYNVTVRAIDQAGNSIESKIKLEIVPIESPVITFITDKLVGKDIIRLKGSAPIGDKVVITIENSKKSLVSQSEVAVDTSGQWAFQLDRTLDPGQYTVTVITKDSRSALSLPVVQKINVNATPLISIFGLDITLGGLTIILVIIAIGLLVYFRRIITLRILKTSRGSVVVGRDLSNAMNQIKGELDKIDLRKSKGTDPATQIPDNEISVKKIREVTDNIDKYVKKEIEDLK
jgi:hypothetical protein